MRVRSAVVASAAVAAVAWVATPIVSMARRGTIDQRTVRSWRAEGRSDDASARIPAPRAPAEATDADPADAPS